MEFDQLRYFIEVANTGNLTRASEKLHIAQSAVSRQIKLLEEEFGQKLFIRSRYSMVLTDVGQKLFGRAVEIVDLAKLTEIEIAGNNREVQGELSVAFIDRTFFDIASSFFSSFMRSYPKIRLHFYSGCLDYVNTLYRRRVVDIAFTFMADLSSPDIIDRTRFLRRMGFVMRDDSKLAKHSEITEKLYSREPIILPKGNIIDGNGQSLLINIPRENIKAEVQEPLDFLDMVKDTGAYLYCLEPISEVLSSKGLVFRPLSPYKSAALCAIQQPSDNPSDALLALRKHIKIFFGNR